MFKSEMERRQLEQCVSPRGYNMVHAGGDGKSNVARGHNIIPFCCYKRRCRDNFLAECAISHCRKGICALPAK